MTLAVLDASALLALLLGEPGADRVREVLAGSALSTINLAEVVGHFSRNGAAENDIRLVLEPLPIDLIGLDEEAAYAAGLLLPVTRAAGLSLGDRVCLALARRLGVPAVTADRAWRGIAAAVGVEVELIR
ncbi:MAG TPA: type II toxin-antitoxin system VapC family toxin [Stellaceae bacterium]|nr:type II toxin-antitoxin system VapC family toxin [Stellaceae bacterium]